MRRVAGRFARKSLVVVVPLATLVTIVLAAVGNVGGALVALSVALMAAFAYVVRTTRVAARRDRVMARDNRAILALLRNRRLRGIAAAKGRSGAGSTRAAAAPITFAPAKLGGRAPATSFKVGVIMDEFTELSFRYEWHQVRLMPATWSEQLDTEQFDLIFVESAWQGNGGKWRYALGSADAPRPAIVELAAEARRRGIPTVFWNKEDPPHYDVFLESARLFDWVFTSDRDRVEHYRRDLGHDRIQALPFAAQTAIHRPVRDAGSKRSGAVAFGGSYVGHKYPERQAQMDELLPAAMEVGLDIFSRVPNDPKYRFPAPYDAHVRGTLPYRQMLTAYRAYKVFLNVNSVIDSTTMCARRIFEITAAGSAVLSAPSAAIRTFFGPDEVGVAGTTEEARAELALLLGSDEFRERRVHRAQRVVWSQHTYAHRAHQILEAVGLVTGPRTTPRVSVLAVATSGSQLDAVLASVARQADVDVELVVMLQGWDEADGDVKTRATDAGVHEVVVRRASADQGLATVLNELVEASSGEYVARMDATAYYAPHYLADAFYALVYSAAAVVGKRSSYVHFAGERATVLVEPTVEHRYCEAVLGATMFGTRATFVEAGFSPESSAVEADFLAAVRASGAKVYAADRFNFAVLRQVDAPEAGWAPVDTQLFASGVGAAYGDVADHVTV